MHLCIPAVRRVGFDCAQGSQAVLQRRCKTFVSRGDLQCSQAECRARGVCLFQGGNWRSVLSARNAAGDAIPTRRFPPALCFSSPPSC